VEECGTLPIFLGDVKARHDRIGGFRTSLHRTSSYRRTRTSYGAVIRRREPGVRLRQLTATDRQPSRLGHELLRHTDDGQAGS